MKDKKKRRNRGGESMSPQPHISKEKLSVAEAAVSELAQSLWNGQDEADPMEMFQWAIGRLVSKAMEVEMDHHLGYRKGGIPPVGLANRRNGKTTKTVRSSLGPIEVEVPRDREGSFEPKIVPKHKRTISEFEDKIVAMYGRGMTVRDIQRTLKEVYGTDVSPQFISDVTDRIIDDLNVWRNRILERLYYVVYIDAMFARTREKGTVSKRACYTVVGMAEDGSKDVLGLYVADTESAKFWMSVLEDLRARGVERIGVIAADGLTGLPEAIEGVFPKAVFQTCVVHLIRASVKLVPWKDRKALCADLRQVYSAPNEEEARNRLEAFKNTWDHIYPMVAAKWQARWNDWTPFLALPQEARKIIYTTNAVEALHRRLRKVIKNRGSFPNDTALLKTLFLALKDAKAHWGRPARYWTQARLQLAIHFDLIDDLEA